MADFIGIHYPNGSVEGCQMFVWDGTKPVLWDGSISVVSTGSAIQDGADSSIKATVKDYTNSNPLAVITVDTNGDPVAGTGGGPATIADGADVTQGAIADAKVLGDNAGTVSAKLRGINTELKSIDDKTPALGQALAAASTPVVLTAAQLTTLTPPAAITGFLTEADFDTKTGSLTETAPATDTASSGLNGRLQRIAQRITSLIAALGSPFQAGGSIGNTSFGSTNFPTTVDTNSGNKSASTLRVVLATDQPALTNKLLVTPDSVALPANQSVNVSQINGVTPLMGAGNTGTGSPRVTIATDQAIIPVGGTVADDGTTPDKPVMVGGTAKSPDGTDPGNVSAEDDVIRLIGDLNRRLYTNTHHPRTASVHLDGSSAYTDQNLVSAPGSGLQTVITNIIASTGAATALNFFLEEGSTKIFGPIYLEAVAGRGFCSGPIYLPVTANTAVTLTSSASIAQSFQIEYFIQKV